MANWHSALVRVLIQPKVRETVTGMMALTAKSVIAPTAGGLLTELGITGLGGTLTSIGGGTAIAATAAGVGAALAPVAVGAAAFAGIYWLCSDN